MIVFATVAFGTDKYNKYSNEKCPTVAFSFESLLELYKYSEYIF